MNKLFIHNPLFRLFSPVFSGIVVYLLILLINNNVEQLQEQFLGKELYFCIGLSFIIHEFSRLLLWVFNKLPSRLSSFFKLLIQVIGSMLLCAILVTIAIVVYYKVILGFSPSTNELWLFNSIFCSITFIYVMLHLSHQYLYKENTKILNNEYIKKQLIEDDFIQFEKGINPNLLFECFEAIIVLARKKSDNVDDLIDHIAIVYRYILSTKNKQLVTLGEELNAAKELVQLFNYLPYRVITLTTQTYSNFLIVPGSLLTILEDVIKNTINSSDSLDIEINETHDSLALSYVKNDKINSKFNPNFLSDIKNRYTIYSKQELTIKSIQDKRIISIPKLITKPNL
ncbi:histidine kinase [Pontimicrobium aquaticum]|uniref:Histidine kinase n=1 Tax=Pontimicrobium aquaticum TaxID=2565367 RepID=A0A4U0EP70_9FLAO|nr:histidine kinase [Pontimicrobium aquaticum]TJY33361.1 histidine kinase [Pontimicrobium aquaticum]